MANVPIRITSQSNKLAISTRSRTTTIFTGQARPKRKADFSPVKEAINTKRTALGDVTNAATKKIEDKKKGATLKQPTKKTTVQAKILPSVRTVIKAKQSENVPPRAPCVKGITTRASVKNIDITNQTALKAKEPLKENTTINRIKTRLSNEFEKTEETLYSSALEEL